MTSRQQWTIVAGLVTTAVFGMVLALKLHSEINLVGVGSRAPEFRGRPWSGCSGGSPAPTSGSCP